ncbi:MAG: hypothetical protein ABSG46_14080 [Candidatus Binataceae bacterium]|jgi:hypothetical protein
MAPQAPFLESGSARPPASPNGDRAEAETATQEIRRQRSALRYLAEILQFADLMALMMVLATVLSAVATWRTAGITRLLVSIAERPYVGVERVDFDSIGDGSARLLIDCRNFGHVSGTDGVVRIRLALNGKPLASINGPASTVNVGMFAPSVPQLFFRFVPQAAYTAAHDGNATMVVQVAINYRGPDSREFCYTQILTYDHRADAFSSAGGSDRCDDEIY